MAKKLPRKIKLTEKKLGREKALGVAISPDQIVIAPQRSRERLDTTIHEGLHLLLPEAPEVAIIAYSNRLSALLWLDGWRRVER
jgi:hypothetical protein